MSTQTWSEALAAVRELNRTLDRVEAQLFALTGNPFDQLFNKFRK